MKRNDNESSFFEDLKAGLEAGIEHQRGGRKLRVTRIVVPPPPRTYGAREVQSLRRHLSMSQSMFAKLLHVSSRTVQMWEQGLRVPSQAAARLMQFVEQPDLLQGAVGHGTAPELDVRSS
jgi:putative transcriptional regulator